MSSHSLFPPHVRTFDAAVDFIVAWVEMVGGEITSGLEVLQSRRALHVARTTVAFTGTGTVLTFGFTVESDLAATWYTFDLRRSNGELLWRHDCHAGHEAALGGLHHLHIGPDEEHRIPRSKRDPRTGCDEDRRHARQPRRLTAAAMAQGTSAVRRPVAPMR